MYEAGGLEGARARRTKSKAEGALYAYVCMSKTPGMGFFLLFDDG